jgi:CRISPR-associated Csx2 family protein
MAKVIISFLGTGGYQDRKNKSRGEYKTATYSINENKKSHEYKSDFVSEALYKHYNADRVIYIGTLKSMWEVVYDNKTFINNPNDNSWQILAELVENAGYTTPIEKKEIIENIFKDSIITPIVVKYGLDDKENEYNIKQLFGIESILNSEDELYIDISHGFRSLPMVLTNALNFIIENSSKKITVANISYGMFEVSHEMDERTPIVNLNILNDLNQTVKASHEFNEYGSGFLFSKLLKETNKSISTMLNDFSISSSLNHIFDLRQKINQLNGIQFEKLTPLQKLAIEPVIKRFIKQFNQNEKDSIFQYKLALWMFENKKYNSAAITLLEGLITKVCEREGFPVDDLKYRNLSKKLIVVAGKNEKNAGRLINELKEEGLNISRKNYRKYNDFQEYYGQLNSIRISLAHSVQNKMSVKQMVLIIENFLNETKALFYNNQPEKFRF